MLVDYGWYFSFLCTPDFCCYEAAVCHGSVWLLGALHCMVVVTGL